jgi:hypothetical protein
MNESTGRSTEGLRFHAQDQVDFRTHTAVASGKLMYRRDEINSDRQILRNWHLSH